MFHSLVHLTRYYHPKRNKPGVDPNTDIFYSQTEAAGDSQDLTVTEPGPEIICDVCGVLRSTVVMVSGRPIVIEPNLSQIGAVVAAWLPGSEGQ